MDGKRPVCPNPDCPSHADGLREINIHGRNACGSFRYVCKRCGRTFSTGKRRGNGRHFARRYADWLMKNGYPVSETAGIVGVSRRTLHRWFSGGSSP